MLKIYDVKDKKEFIPEIAMLTQKEWGNKCVSEEVVKEKINKKIDKINSLLDNEYYCKLILINELENELIGFISIFPTDGEYRTDLKPWYATMYVKEKYRGKGYSKILNDAIINEAKRRRFSRIYLKSELKNYYEKFGAKFLESLPNGEKLYYIDL